VQRDLPSGTVTFLFTDVEGSTRLLHDLGADAYADALGEHRRILRGGFTANGGVEVDTQGDAFFVAFRSAPGALGAAAEALEGLAQSPIRVRVGIHTLTGAGGSGKTRLGLQVVAELVDAFDGGVFVVPLAGLSAESS
jgi:class 3 adenylate cyclase